MVNPEVAASQRLYLTTGGSSGVPVGFYLQKGVSRPKEQAYLEAQWVRRGYRVGDRVAVIRGGVTSSRADGEISYYDAARNWLILSSAHLTPARLAEYVAALNRFRPQHLNAYPSAALMLMQMGAKLEFPLISLLCGSERLTPENQRQLEQHFGAPVMHWYGHSERAVLAAQGRKSDLLHFWPTYGWMELGTPDEEGNREIIGTSFHNAVMPLVRYRTGDHARLPEADAREFSWPAIEALIGRDYEFLIGHGGRRVSLTTINLHDRFFTEVMALQFRQSEPGAARVCYVPAPTFAAETLVQMKQVLQHKLGDDFRLEFEQVSDVEKTPAGKHRWLITTLKEGKKI
jgi:phenylacetate-CoA ligase